MSLMVWLPLNGDLTNQGLDGSITISGSPSYHTAGKIGKGMNTAGATVSGTSPALNGAKQFTLAFWIIAYEDATSTNTWNQCFQVGTKTSAGAAGSNFRFESCYGSSLRACSFHNNATYSITQSSRIIVQNKGEWHHVCVTCDGTNLYSYRDGIKIYTDAALGGSLTGTFIIGTTNKYLGCINDVRIYDHCLSAKEVKEISKGLILHHKLDNNGFGNKNMAVASDENTNWSWTMQTGGYTRSYEDAEGGRWCCLTRDSVAHSGWSVIYYNNEISRTEIKPNSTYTVSFEILPSHTFNLGLSIMDTDGTDILTNGTKYQTVQANVINKVAITVTTLATLPSATTQKLYITGMNTAVGAIYKFRRVKVEEGNKATVWCPNSADVLYSTWGMSSLTEYDCSGFKNNGTASVSLSQNTSSPRYETSTNIDDVKYITLSNLAFENIANGSLSFWIKFNDFNKWSHYVFIANSFNWTGQSNDFIIVANQNNLSASTSSTPLCLDCCSYTSAHTVSTGRWYHITITWDVTNYTIKKYIDGTLVSTVNDATNKRLDTYRAKHNTCGIGNVYKNASYSGNFAISDFRIYATTLSDSEVKELSTIPASIDKNGNFYAYEFKEV